MTTVTQLENELKDKNLKSLYLFYGKETYLIDNCLKKIKKNFGNLVEGLNYIKIDDSSLSTFIPELQTPPFGFEKKLIIVKGTELLKSQGKRKNQVVADEVQKITDYFEENWDSIELQNVVVFIEEEIQKNELFKEIEKRGVVCNFELQKPVDIAKRIKFICNSYSVNIDTKTLNYFIDVCGTNLQDLINEIRKLIEYSGTGGTITDQDIDALCIKQFDSVIFDLTDNLGKKNVAKSIEVLNNLLYAKEPIQKILITLYNHFKKIYIVKLCTKYNKDILEQLKLKPNQTFLVSKYKKQSAQFTEMELKVILFRLIDLDEKYKLGQIDLNIGLETIITQIA